MKKMNFLKIACVAALSAACCFAIVGCSSQSNSDSGDVSVGDTSEGVAATVNGKEIGEKAVTAYIANFRSMSNLEADADWAQWLVDNNYTASDIREEVINYYTSQELIRQAAEENGVTVDSSEVDAQVQQMRSYYDSDEDWQSALKQIGTTESQYRSLLEISMLQKDLQEKVAQPEDPSDEELLQYAQMYATYYNGAKKSSHILFNSDDEATAQEVLDRINSGELDFADAAAQYSQDSGSKDDGGNVGWDKLTSFVDEYQTALDGLEEGQVSGLVTSSYGIHIIKCTQVFNAPDEVTSTDQLPSEFMDSIKSTLESSAKQQAYSQWYQDYKSNADIQINDMPSGLAYDVSLDGVEPSSDSSSSDSSADNTADATSSDTDASSDASATEANTESSDSSNATSASTTTAQPSETKSE
mgnify:CR=1 FL=1